MSKGALIVTPLTWSTPKTILERLRKMNIKEYKGAVC